MHFGSCLCGGVKFEISGELSPIQICHCSQCRKAQGGPFATNIPVARNSLKFTLGAELKTFESSPGKRRVFCAVCGSPVYSERDSQPDVVRIRAGLLNEPVNAGLQFHAYMGSKASWWPVVDELPKHVAGYTEPPKS